MNDSRADEPGFLRPPLLVLSPARQLAGEALMDRTVAHSNIEHYRKLLTQEMDEAADQLVETDNSAVTIRTIARITMQPLPRYGKT